MRPTMLFHNVLYDETFIVDKGGKDVRRRILNLREYRRAFIETTRRRARRAHFPSFVLILLGREH